MVLQMDVDNSGSLTLEEIVAGIQSNSMLRDLMERTIA